MVRTPHSHFQEPGSVPGQGTKIPKAMWHYQKKKKKRGKLFYWKRTPCPSKRDQLAKSWFIHIMKANCFKKKRKRKPWYLWEKVFREKSTLQTTYQVCFFVKQD